MRKALLTTALVLLLPGTAGANIFEGSGADASSETTPALDITAISARYDEVEGSVAISTQLAAGPEAAPNGLVTAVLAAGCGAGGGAIFLDRLVPQPADPGLYTADGSTPKPLTRGGTPPVVTFAATDIVLYREGYTCLTVQTKASTASGAPVADTAQVRLADVTPPPAPTPAPTPVPTATPTPEAPPLGPSPLTRSEQLEAALAKCANVKCKRSARKRFGPTKREQYRAALDRCKSKSCERRAKARFRGVKAAPKPTGLERRLYANGASDVLGSCGGICWEALSFVDRRYVYVGLPEGAGVPNCTRVTYNADDEEGCSTYSVKGKTVTVAATGRKYAIGKDLVRQPAADETEKTTLTRQVFPSAGSRWDVPEIEAIGVYGSPFIGTQTITKTYLTLNRAGQFIRSSFSFGGTAPGAAVTVNFATAPKDTKGTYEVLPAGTIRLTFEDGHVEVGSTFFYDPAKGRDPNLAGLHAIDDTYFGPPDD